MQHQRGRLKENVLFCSYLFWTDRVRKVVERSSLSGDNRITIANSGLAGPSAIAVDAPTEKLFWLDAPSGVIYKSNLDGTANVRLIKGEAVKNLAGLAVGRVSMIEEV